jgi:hypothetical protein
MVACALIPPTQEVEVGGLRLRARLKKGYQDSISKTKPGVMVHIYNPRPCKSMRLYLINKEKQKDWRSRYDSMLEHLPRKCKVLNSNFSAAINQ